MANVRANASGKLFFDFYFRGVRCREYTLLKDTAANKRLMEQKLKQIEKEIAAGLFSYSRYFPTSRRAALFESGTPCVPAPTLAELSQAAGEAAQLMRVSSDDVTVAGGTSPLFPVFAAQWFEEREIDWKRSNRLKVRDILDVHMIPRFQGRRIGHISKADILAFRNYLAKECREGRGLSNARINGVLNVLRQILDEAADRYRFASPFRNIKPLRVARTVVDPFTIDEVESIIASVPKAFQPLYTVAFFTGMRTSELLGLQWDAVDLDRNQLQVRTTWVCGELDTPKTDGSERTIEISSPVAAALRHQRALTAELKSDFVFCSTNGEALSRHNLANRIWKPSLAALGLRHRPPYQTRHTAATLWLAAGEAPEWIAKQMGHTSTKMLFTVYSRYVPNLTRKDGSMFELLIGGRFNGAAGEPSDLEKRHDE